MKLKYCPICKSKLTIEMNYDGSGLNKSFCNKDLYNNTFHFEMSVEEIIYRTSDFRLTINKLIDVPDCFYISYSLNNEFKAFAELSNDFNIFFDKAFEILDNEQGILKIKMLIKKFEALVLFL